MVVYSVNKGRETEKFVILLREDNCCHRVSGHNNAFRCIQESHHRDDPLCEPVVLAGAAHERCGALFAETDETVRTVYERIIPQHAAAFV